MTYEFNLTEAELDNILNSQTRQIELIGPDFEGYQALPEGDKKALTHLINAANAINEVALIQDNPHNLSALQYLSENQSSHAKKALLLFQSFNGVAGINGIDPKPIEIFKGVHQNPGRNFYPFDITSEELADILIQMLEEGKTIEVQKILSARTMVERLGNELKAIDYTQYFEKQFSYIANELEVAAHYTTEHEMKDYLSWQAQAFLQNNPEMDSIADKHWAAMQNNRLEFTVSRENYEDELTGSILENPKLKALLEAYQIEVCPKDTLGARVGIVNKQGTDFILKSKETLPFLADLMPYKDRYTQKIEKTGKQTMVDVDLMALKGDYAMCRGGITTAQNLPNDDKLSVKTGGGRRNVYHRQVRFSYDHERAQKLLESLVAKEFHPYYQHEADHDMVIGHENGHSLGPDNSFKSALGIYSHTIEEHKANTISIAFMSKVAEKFGTYTNEDLKRIYTTWIIRLFLKAKPTLSKPHRMADLIEFNYLMAHQAIFFDGDNKLHINFEKIPEVMYHLLEETIAVQLSKSPQIAKDFIEKWTTWSEILQYIAEIQEKLGNKPYIQLITKF